jgi:hypothetical protein
VKTGIYNQVFYVIFLSVFILAGICPNLWAIPVTIKTSPPPSAPALSAFDQTVTGTVTSTVSDGNLFQFDVSLDAPYLFGEFFVFLDAGHPLAAHSLDDINAPDKWVRYGFIHHTDKKKYVAYQTHDMSEKNIMLSESGFQVRLNNTDSPLGYGFHIKEADDPDNTYFALLQTTIIPEPGALFLFGTGALLFLGIKRKIVG